MQIVSGPIGREKIHYQAPPASQVAAEMGVFLDWFNQDQPLDGIIKAGIAHLWFVTIHPFDDGNGRIARAVCDMALARADHAVQRFYSLSAQIQQERDTYYNLLEHTQRGKLHITDWLTWFLGCLLRALQSADDTLSTVLNTARFWQHWADTSLNPRQVKVLKRLLDGLEGKLTNRKWAKIAQCSADTALRDITALLKLGVLQKTNAGGRSTSYEITPV
jgi:Fic family protein